MKELWICSISASYLLHQSSPNPLTRGITSAEITLPRELFSYTSSISKDGHFRLNPCCKDWLTSSQFFPEVSTKIFPSCPLSYPSAHPNISLAISMLSPVAEDISRILPQTFFLQGEQNSSPTISSHITCSSPDHPDQFSLTQSLLSQRAQTRHSTPDVSPSTQERNITLPSPCWPCLCWYSPAGQAGLQCHKDKLLTHVLLPAPCKSFHAASPQPVLLHSSHISGAGLEPPSAVLQPFRVSWTHFPVLQFISHCPPSQLPKLAGAVQEHQCPRTMKDSSQK